MFLANSRRTSGKSHQTCAGLQKRVAGRGEDSIMFFSMNGSADTEPFHEMVVPVGIVSLMISPCGAPSDLSSAIGLDGVCGL